jgi:hypothetical protein
MGPTGAAQGQPGSVQYGYSDGMLFPPFGAVTDRTDLYVFVPNFVLPLRFIYKEDVTVKGIKLRRSALS